MVCCALVSGGQELVVDVVVPASDCAGTLAAVLGALPWRRLRSVVVVDSASRDATGQVARDAGAVVLRESRPGYGAACLRALHHLESLPRRPDVVAFVDPRGTADPRELPALLAPIGSEGAELALAVPAQKRRPLSARIATGAIGLLYRHDFAGVDACRAVRYPALVALGLSDRGSGWNVEMQVKALRLGLRIVEVEVAARAGQRALEASPRQALGSTGRALFRILRHTTAR